MSLVQAVRRANRPGPPEHSVALRVATASAVTVAIAACFAEGELNAGIAAITVVLIAAGMTYSYLTRVRPRGWIKPFLALFAVGAFTWFFLTATSRARSGDIGSVEGPLAALFAWIQVGHAFDVPARRDLAFSLAGSTTLMAVAAAQAVSPDFGLYVVVWVACALAGMLLMWSSISGGHRVGIGLLAATLAGTAAVTFAALLVLPAPHVSSTILFPSDASGDSGLQNPAGLAGDGADPNEPAQAGTPSGPTRVGGFLGFSKHLDTALRADLSDEVIMRVRAQAPSYFLGETFDKWDGQSWTSTVPPASVINPTGQTGSPFILSDANAEPTGRSDLQTFYLAVPGPNLLFHADVAREVWFPVPHLFVSDNEGIVAGVALGKGTIYTVESDVSEATPAQLERAAGPDVPYDEPLYLQLPRPCRLFGACPRYARARALAERVTASAPTTYDKVEALIAWIGHHTRYSTDIPPLRAGQDSVNQFLFGTRVGFCEQISTALSVMLRLLGIPTREAVGYVPGPYNPITDLYDIQASDAHAWVQVWFPGYGWQSFDPTAVVPLANPSPARVLLAEVGHVVERIPPVPVGGGLVLVAGITLGVRWWRRRPATWAHDVERRMARRGARARMAREPGETLAEYARRMEHAAGAPGTWTVPARAAEAAAYGGRHPPATEQRALLASVAALPLPDRRRGRTAPAGARPLKGAGAP